MTREGLVAAEGMVAGDFSAEVEVSEEFVEVEGTARPTPAGAWVFLRRELMEANWSVRGCSATVLARPAGIPRLPPVVTSI
jgi:hypothetical protein